LILKVINFEGWAWWFMSTIPATQKAAIKRFTVQGQLGEKVIKTLS
jgi:hypothetical protein